MNEPRLVVLDASAVVAWLFRERGAETVSKVLARAVLPVSAMVESLYRAKELSHQLSGFELYDAIVKMGVLVEPVIGDDAVRAASLISDSRQARIRANGPCLSLGDGLCLAVAERLNLPVTGGDQFWSSLNLNVEFFPFR